jgi:isocitrate/isopropylmalate dehydrogenase
VLRAADERFSLDLELEEREIGLASLAAVGTTLPSDILTRTREVDGVLLGPVSHYDYPARNKVGINPSAELRTVFNLYSNVRPCRSREDLSILRHSMDIVIVR